jgi:hypothetical protein
LQVPHGRADSERPGDGQPPVVGTGGDASPGRVGARGLGFGPGAGATVVDPEPGLPVEPAARPGVLRSSRSAAGG